LNRERLASPTGRQILEYGAPPAAPRFSVIVPLHGRLDFVEYQQALFSARPDSSTIEYIYVLDDPAARREAQNLFASVYARFQVPFRAVLLERNIGFAPANNIGMAYAHGEFLVYLNSDIFPGALDWLEQLAAAFASDPSLGVIGPLLLFEDGSIQHRGMYFEQLPEYANWYFCQHHDKGLRPAAGGGLSYVPSITGACMMLPRALAAQIGGFDETYIIGDFEDSDLCLKLHALGYRCAVDPDVYLYHLERKSQLSSATLWRANLTAYNAWEHDRRWAAAIAALPAPEPASW
jgi:GT2 family glycosyltransferase